MVTIEMREQFHARFVLRLGKLLGFGQNASEIIS